MKKQIWEITESDLMNHPVWFFPMTEDEDSDEATVLPVSETETISINTQSIVASEFTDNNGNKFFGYMYWAKPIRLEDNQPLMWVNGNPTSFWFGIQEPSKEEMLKLNFPIKVKSIPFSNHEAIEIEILGYGYINGNEIEYVNS